MYVNKESGIVVYETWDELLKADVDYVTYYDGNYYFRLKTDNPYDHLMWKVDEKTKKVSDYDILDYIMDIQDKAKSIDIKELRRVS